MNFLILQFLILNLIFNSVYVQDIQDQNLNKNSSNLGNQALYIIKSENNSIETKSYLIGDLDSSESTENESKLSDNANESHGSTRQNKDKIYLDESSIEELKKNGVLVKTDNKTGYNYIKLKKKAPQVVAKFPNGYIYLIPAVNSSTIVNNYPLLYFLFICLFLKVFINF